MVRFNSGETSQANLAALWTKYNIVRYVVRLLGEVEVKVLQCNCHSFPTVEMMIISAVQNLFHHLF